MALMATVENDYTQTRVPKSLAGSQIKFVGTLDSSSLVRVALRLQPGVSERNSGVSSSVSLEMVNLARAAPGHVRRKLGTRLGWNTFCNYLKLRYLANLATARCKIEQTLTARRADMLTCHDVAKYFLSLVDEDAGDSISNLKLQKLVYYAQGYCLAIHDRPLFVEPIEAWEHGPVVPELYRSFKQHGAQPLPVQKVTIAKFLPEEIKLLDEIWEMFGQFSATKLRNMTHHEDPYKKTPKGQVISRDLMKVYFKTQLVEEA